MFLRRGDAQPGIVAWSCHWVACSRPWSEVERVQKRGMKMLRVFETALPENLLVREILHEVNNDFASAVRLVSLTAAQSSSGDARVALDVVGDRSKKYANVHHALQMPMSDGRLEGPARSLDAPFDC